MTVCLELQLAYRRLWVSILPSPIVPLIKKQQHSIFPPVSGYRLRLRPFTPTLPRAEPITTINASIHNKTSFLSLGSSGFKFQSLSLSSYGLLLVDPANTLFKQSSSSDRRSLPPSPHTATVQPPSSHRQLALFKFLRDPFDALPQCCQSFTCSHLDVGTVVQINNDPAILPYRRTTSKERRSSDFCT